MIWSARWVLASRGVIFQPTGQMPMTSTMENPRSCIWASRARRMASRVTATFAVEFIAVRAT